jgi:hypothetical protein
MTLTGWAAGYAEELLAPLGDRWAHVQGVVRQAQEVAAILPVEEREVLVAAAYLHDLGYAHALVETGFHALDGARHLRVLGHERLAGLVAYHSGAGGEAELRGLTAELAEFADEDSWNAAMAPSMSSPARCARLAPRSSAVLSSSRAGYARSRHPSQAMTGWGRCSR